MTMLEWAKKEIELACKKENPDWDGKSFDYGCSCYQSALKAFESLLDDDHSGFSWSITKEILIRLMEHLPLQPITDEDFKVTEGMFNGVSKFLEERGFKSSIQCPRMSSLFRDEKLDGTVTYSDVSRTYGIDIETNRTYGGGGIDKYVDELFPITMPYYPPKNKFKVYTQEFLVNPEEGDWDHKAYLYMITPEGKEIRIDKYFKYVGDKQIEITKEEFEDNYKKRIK